MKKIFTIILCLASVSIYSQTKRVLIEEGTGTWCQWCPRGMVYAHDMMVNYDAIPIAIHNSDPMETSNTASYFTSANLGGLPSGNVDRKHLDIDPLSWGSYTSTLSALTPPLDVYITTSFDTVSRQLDFTITADIFTSLNGGYRVGAIIVEDAITGPAPSYNQSNAYAGGGNGIMGGFENLPSSIPASQIAYDHVARHLASDYDGDIGSLPSNLVATNQYNYSLNWVLPTDQDENYVYVVGYIVDTITGEIVNANKSAYIMGDTNALPKFLSQPLTVGIDGSNYLYEIWTHDPDNSILNITIQSGPAWLSIATTSNTTAELTGTPTSPGNYPVVLEVSDGVNTTLQTFTIAVSSSTGEDWHFVGLEAFTPSDANKTDIEIGSDSTPYLMYTNGQDQVVVNQYVNSQWTTLGQPISGDQFAAAMALDPITSLPHVITVNSAGQVVVNKWNNTSWQQLGTGLGSGASSLDIAVANDGSVYATFMDIANSSMGICKKWDGSNWLTVGGNHFNASTGWAAVWTKIVTDSQNNPFILYATGSGSWGPFNARVAYFNGTNWSNLGGGDIDNVAVAFNHSIAIDSNDKVYVSASTDNTTHLLNVYTFDGSVWQNIGANLANGAVYYNDLAISLAGEPTVVFEDESTGKTSVMKYDGNAWNTVGLPLFTNSSANQSIAYSNSGIPYIAYRDETLSDKISVKIYGILNPPTNVVESRINNNVYPNPAINILNIELEESASYIIYDIQSRKIKKGNLNKGLQTLNIKDLKKGLYFLQINDKELSNTIPFVKQ